MSDDKNNTSDKTDKNDTKKTVDANTDKTKSSKLSKPEKFTKPTKLIESTEPLKPNQQKESPTTKNNDPLFNAKPAPKLDSPSHKKPTRILPIIASLLAIVAIIGVIWAAYNQYKMQQSWQLLQTEYSEQSQQLQALTKQSGQLAQNSLAGSQKNQQVIIEQNQIIQQLNQALTATQQHVRALSGRQKQDWLLAEAEYLIRLAQLKILLEHDKLTAIALLKTADQRVLETADNSLLELRQQITDDITRLQLISVPDISGISSQLNAISQQVPLLSLVALEFEPLASATQKVDKSEQAFSWQGMYQDFLNDFVTIKDHSQPVKPLMTLNQRGNLNSNIQLAIQQAQIALLRGEQNLYEMHLTQAINWISSFFQHNQSATSIMTSLQTLVESPIKAELPKELAAVNSIQSINQQRLYQWLENQETKQATPSQTESPDTLDEKAESL